MPGELLKLLGSGVRKPLKLLGSGPFIFNICIFIGKICMFIFNIDFFAKLAFESEVVILGNSAFFRILCLALISAKPYYQNARIDRGIIFCFR